MRIVPILARRAALALACAAIASLTLAPFAAAQLHHGVADADPSLTYILNATATWGDAQDQAIAQAGGTRVWVRPELGVGVVTSNDPGFLDAVLAGGAFEGGSHDQTVAWGQARSAAPLAEAAAITPGDETEIHTMWNLTAIDAFGAWTQGYDGSGVRVAVLDGGICTTHIELRDNLDLSASRSFIPGEGVDSDGPGFMHACHLAGVVAAEDNGFGGIGVAPHATIVACKVTDRGFGTFEALLQAIAYAADPLDQGGAGADIILVGPNTRLHKGGGTRGDDALINAFKRAVKYATKRGVLVVTGVGDDGADLDHPDNVVEVPAESDGAIGVAATGPEGFAVGYPNGSTNFTRPASTSNFGHEAVWMSAPGGDDTEQTPFCTMPRAPSGSETLACYVFDMIVGPGYVSGSKHVVTRSMGTAVAAAHVAGVAALVKQKYPNIRLDDLKELLAHSAQRIGHGPDKVHYGRGFLNARLAVSLPLDGPSHGIAPTIEPAARAQLVVAASGSATKQFVIRLPYASRARLELYDVAGRSVATLYDGAAASGVTTVSWNGSGRGGQPLRNGAYFARLAAGSLQASRLVILAR